MSEPSNARRDVWRQVGPTLTIPARSFPPFESGDVIVPALRPGPPDPSERAFRVVAIDHDKGEITIE